MFFSGIWYRWQEEWVLRFAIITARGTLCCELLKSSLQNRAGSGSMSRGSVDQQGHILDGSRGSCVTVWHADLWPNIRITRSHGSHRNEIWVKIGYNLACMTDISDILASNRGFSWSSNWTMSVKFFHFRPWLPWQQNWTKTGLNSACMRYISQILKSSKGFHSRAITRC